MSQWKLNIAKTISISCLAFLFFALSLGVRAAESTIKHVEIAVLGGGMSGLTAAYDLHKKGIKVEVFEGRDRLGGRTNTHYFKKGDYTQYFEEGGTDIDDDHHATIALAKELKVDLTKQGFGTGKISIFNGQNAVPLASFEKELGTLEKFFSDLDNQFTKNPQYAEYDAYGKVRYKPLSTFTDKSPLSPVAQGFLKTFYEGETGVPFAKGVVYHIKWLQNELKEYHSLLGYRNSRFVPGFAINQFGFHYRVTQGMSHFVNQLAEHIKKTSLIHLSHKLTHLSKADNGYVLTFEIINGHEKHTEKVLASKVIMTLPFSTLRLVTIDPSVKLPELTSKAIHTLQYGTNAKIGMKASGQQDISDNMLYYVNLKPSIISWPGKRALTIYLSAEEGEQLNDESMKSILNATLPNIQHEHPGFQFDSPVIINWAKDEFARGSYSAVTTDTEADLVNPSNIYPDLRMFADPLGESLIIAGEHTRADGTDGHIEGAVRSGIFASKLILEKKSSSVKN